MILNDRSEYQMINLKNSEPPAQPDEMAGIGKTVEQYLSAGPPSPQPNQEAQLPPGFGQGFSIQNGKSSVFQEGQVCRTVSSLTFMNSV